MKLYSENKNYKLYHGSMLDMLEHIEPNSIDSVVTDPPYELNFMNKGWDNAGVSFQPDTWKRCYEVLKPGGYLLAFGGSRTFHRIAVAIEDAGFEIRDTIMWIYGSGFPKSMNIGLAVDKKNGTETLKEAQNGWKGWGSCLKPSFEPIIVARKPLEGTLVDNVLTYGVGGLNIDESRVETNGELIDNHKTAGTPFMRNQEDYKQIERSKSTQGRFPANTILTYDETDYEEVCSGFPMSGSGNNKGAYNYAGREYDNKDTSMFNGDKPQAPSNYNDSGSASRYFYCAKASKKDRDEGLDNIEGKQRFQQGIYSQSPVCSVCGKTFNGTNDHSLCGEHTMIYKSKEENTVRKNTHPTVKPTELMQYLIRLVTPNGGTILDPFNGSGSTGKATMYENRERNKDYKYIGIELTEEYLPIAKARIEYPLTGVLHNDKKETKVTQQVVAEQNKEVSLW